MPYTYADAWTRKAKAQGYAARSVFKLDEIEARHRVLPPPGSGAVDLGCFPGSWSRWLIERGQRVVGVDLQAPQLSGGTWIAASVMDVAPEALRDALGGVDPALVVSDMAPNTSGDRFVDHVRQISLADRALDLARVLLPAGRGAFVVKVFDGGDAPAYTQRVQATFEEVRRIKPDATRNRSIEFFLVGKRRR